MGKKLKRRDHASALGSKLPSITPTAKCKLRLLKLERVKDWLLMEEEFVQNQERLKPQEERNEEDRTKVCVCVERVRQVWVAGRRLLRRHEGGWLRGFLAGAGGRGCGGFGSAEWGVMGELGDGGG